MATYNEMNAIHINNDSNNDSNTATITSHLITSSASNDEWQTPLLVADLEDTAITRSNMLPSHHSFQPTIVATANVSNSASTHARSSAYASSLFTSKLPTASATVLLASAILTLILIFLSCYAYLLLLTNDTSDERSNSFLFKNKNTGLLSSRVAAPIDRLPLGHIVIENIETYVTGKADNVIILLPDVFGSKNSTWQVSDRLAASNEFTVLDLQYAPKPWNGSGDVNAWKFLNPFEPILVRLTQFILHIQSRGYTSIQAMGLCYGGRLSLILAQTLLVRSTCAGHPSDLKDYDPVAVIRPVSLIVPQFDDKSFLDQVPYWNRTLAAKQMDYAIKVYPNATHGFFTTTESPSSNNGMQQTIAIQDALNFFRAHK